MMPQLLKFCYSFEPTDGWPNATKCEDPSHWDGGAWLPPAAFELLTEKYAPPECGADGEKAMVANKVLALVARKFPAMCKAVRENACQGFCNDQCPAGSKKQVIGGRAAAPTAAREAATARAVARAAAISAAQKAHDLNE